MLASSGTRLAESLFMTGKSLQEHFREQAELIDRLFTYRFDEFDKKWDAKVDRRFKTFEEKLDAKLEEKFETKLQPINEILKVILARLS